MLEIPMLDYPYLKCCQVLVYDQHGILRLMEGSLPCNTPQRIDAVIVFDQNLSSLT